MENFIIDSLKELDSYKRLLDRIENNNSPILISGNIKENLGHLIYGLNKHLDRQIMLITYEESRGRDLKEDIENLGGEVSFFPEKDHIFYDIDAYDNAEDYQRLKVMSKLSQDKKEIFVTSILSGFDKIISKKIFKELSLDIKLGDSLDLDKIVELFVNNGYERMTRVESVGQFSVRGGIIDFFSPNLFNPVRIELFDDEVDSIRSFDWRTQRSVENLTSVSIVPVKETLILDRYRNEIAEKIQEDVDEYISKTGLEEFKISKVEDKFLNIKTSVLDKVHVANRDILSPYIPEEYKNSIIDYLLEDAIIFIDEPKRVREKIAIERKKYIEDFGYMEEVGELLKSHINMYYEEDSILKSIEKRVEIQNMALLTLTRNMPEEIIKWTVKEGHNYHKKIDVLREDLIRLRKLQYKILILSGSKERGMRLSQDLKAEGIDNRFMEDSSVEISPGDIFILEGSIQGGFEYPDSRFVLINDKDIFGAGQRVHKKRKKDPKKSLDFIDLKVGDYVVHENHGIGKYEGIERLEIQGNYKDYLNIRYREGDKLYVPTDQLHLIQKYIGADSGAPKVNKLSSVEWTKTKEKARRAVEDMAEDLLELYATREEVKGHAFPYDGELQRSFEDYFPHEETYGQLKASREIKEDMESDKPMDRLLCGDVGYGKTEVALRAAFKAVAGNKQVAFLVPTTILAQQHYTTIKKRFEKFPIEVALLSRFKTPKEQKKSIEMIGTGQVDIVVGTHRLLSDDVQFKDIGLLIVDEEQRFGVKHKEKIKTIKSSVDVLTLTATPIPRTLHMSLSGIRDMSVIEEPPEERYPVQTYVAEYNEQIIRDAILKEKARGGQVYFVHNRVKTINKLAKELEELIPEVSFGVAHGQLGERALENVMMDFYNGEYEVLVCTTIIETGMDLQNVNTIIIDDADRLGLSQLYQLRGRVGRSNKLAYAYFLYEENKILSEIAERRLLAIKEFTEFGSGFKVAMRDLEIRGAGNLLGSQQHGQIDAIGYDLYVKFLNSAIKKLKGEDFEEPVDTIIDMEMDAYIPDKYIGVSEDKVEIYKQISSIASRDELTDIIDELIDRFGDYPKEVENLINISYVRGLGSKNNIKSIIQKGKLISVEIEDIDKIKPEEIALLSSKYPRQINFNLGKNPGWTFKVKRRVLEELIGLFEFIDGLEEVKN